MGYVMGFARSRSLTVTADGANNQTVGNSLRKGGIARITAAVFTGAVTLQRKGSDNTWMDVTDNAGTVTTFTKVGTYTIGPNMVPAEYRLNAKAGAVSAFPFTMALEAANG